MGNPERIGGPIHPERGDGQAAPSPDPAASKILVLRAYIEEKGEERVKAGQERAAIIFEDTAKYRDFLDQKTLSGSGRSGDVRYSPLGEILLPTYQPIRTRLVEDSEGRIKKRIRRESGEIVEVTYRREIVNPKDRKFKVKWPPGRNEEYLTNLPEGRDVREQMISTVKTMEDAIEQQKEILGHLGWGEVAGAEVELAKRIIEKTEELAFRFLLKRRITKEDLVILAAETGRFLEEAGLYDPKDKRKNEARNYLIAATQPDIIDRANWLKVVSEILAAHTRAFLRLTAIGKMVGKFDRNLRELTTRKEEYRWRFELTARQLEFILENHSAFTNPRTGVSKAERKALFDAIAYTVREHLSRPKVNPYLRNARWAAINIVGCKEEKEDANRKILGDEEADKLFSEPKVKDLIMRGAFPAVRGRLELSIKRLRKTNATAGRKT